MTTKFTPGPWSIYGDWGIKDSSGRLIAQYEPLCSGIDLGNTKESFANARLIAAAPDMYEALQNMVKLYYSEDQQEQPGQYARAAVAALAKARGEKL